LKDAREWRNRWQIEGMIKDSCESKMPFPRNVRLEWLALEGVAGPLFDELLLHFKTILGEPKEPASSGGSGPFPQDQRRALVYKKTLSLISIES